MLRALRPWSVLFAVVACTGDRAPANDTAAPMPSPPVDAAPRPPRPSTWNRAAGALFAIHPPGDAGAWLVNPAWSDTQALDSLPAADWTAEGVSLTLMDGARNVGTSRVAGVRYDSACVGWPVATLTETAPSWRVAFPEGAVIGMDFDSLPVVHGADSATRVRTGALAASRAPGDTATAFRGRPFVVRQASVFMLGDGTRATLFEVVRLVPQEANPLQEQLLLITEERAGQPMEVAFAEREIGIEDAMGSIELLAVLQVASTGRPAILIRRERESGFLLEWIERTAGGAWTVRWRSATDAC